MTVAGSLNFFAKVYYRLSKWLFIDLRVVRVVHCKIFCLTSFFCLCVFDFYKGKGNNGSPWLNTKVLPEDLADWKLLE